MHGDHHIFGLLATHWHELTKKHRNSEAQPQSANSATSSNQQIGEGVDLYLWTKCYEVCQKTHGETLPCFTMADFNAFLTSHTQNFVTKDCTALDLYNDIFGKQDLRTLLTRTKSQGSATVRKMQIVQSTQSTLVSSDVGGFLDDGYILIAVHAVARFLEKEFPNPLNPVFCVTFRKREAYNAIKYYTSDVDFACLSVPTLLRTLKSTMESVEELKAQVYTEGSTLIMQDLKDDVSEAVKNSQSVSRATSQIIHTIESGSELLRTMSTWANYECTLAEVHDLLEKRHHMLMATAPFDHIQKLKGICDYLAFSSSAIAGTVEELENISSDSLSASSESEPYSSAVSEQSSRERGLVVDVSRTSYSNERLGSVVSSSD